MGRMRVGLSLRIRLYQVGVLVPAALLIALFLHCFIVQPVPVMPGEHDFNFWATVLFRADVPWQGNALYLTFTLGLMATTALAACALAAALALQVPEQNSTRRLAWALIGGSVAAAYIFFIVSHTEYRALLGWVPAAPMRLVYDFVAYSAGLLAPLYLARFFLSYPRALSHEEWEAELLQKFTRARAAMRSSSGWRSWLYPASLRTRMADGGSQDGKWGKFTSDTASARSAARYSRFWQSKWATAALIVWAFLCALFDWLDASQSFPRHSIMSSVKVFLSAFAIIALVGPLGVMVESLQIYSAKATPEDRRKIDWIWSTLFVGGILAGCVQVGSMLIMPLLINFLSARDIFIPGAIMMMGPIFISLQLLGLAFIISLGVSIFYRGAIDPRLAARKITVFGVLGLAVAFLFVLIERTVALKIVAFFNLSPDTGALVAGACVAATVAPVKNHAEKGINSFVGRFLPLDSMIEGEKKTLVVALSDLSGYTSLSSRDEKQAMLLAALLQRQANKLIGAHGGRLVKSMGDAVMFAFDDAPTAAKVLSALHGDFAPAAEQLGITPLKVHSGAHMGEVTIAHDGDLYGQTVNIAARIQGAAAPGQIMVSDTFASATESSSYRDMGPQQFKNLPEAISCRELLIPVPSVKLAV